jgi:hypothetical protein
MKKPIAFIFIVILWSACPLAGQEASHDTEKSCQRFAQDFYDWYVKKVTSDFKASNPSAPWHAALKHDGNPFNPRLTRALIASDAEAKADGDPVLDFDPMLNSQDPADHYVVRSVTIKNNHCWATVYGFWSRPVPARANEPQVAAELEFKGGRWLFVNFHYPNNTKTTNAENENLLSILSYRYHPK